MAVKLFRYLRKKIGQEAWIYHLALFNSNVESVSDDILPMTSRFSYVPTSIFFFTFFN